MNSNTGEKQGEEDENPDKIVNGKWVLIQRGDQERIIEYKAHESIKYGRGSNLQDVSLANASGSLFYSTFRAKLQNEKQKDGKHPGKRCYLEPVIAPEPMMSLPDRNSSGKDNRNIFDDNKSQPLRQADITIMREQGVSGPEIMDTLVANSTSFSQKTEFSQEKYIKKKEKQYGDVIIFLKPTISIVADYYFRKDPSKIMNLRPDSLSQMLTFANVHANGKFMVYETGCSGLLVASILHRLGGLGIALHVHTGSTPQRQALFYMNFTQRDLEPLRSLDVFYIIRPISSNPDKPKSEELPETEEPVVKKSKFDIDSILSKEAEASDDVVIEKSAPNETDEEKNGGGSSSTTSAVGKLGNINRIENEKSLALLNSTEFDGLLICSKEHPLSILQTLLPRLGSSAPFAIFCQYPEPLVECYSWIKETNVGVNLNLAENWIRNIQVETERTHPEINMNSNGGFLLFGICVKQ